jgi:hypothetical protein
MQASLALVFALVVASCGGSSPPPEPPKPHAPRPKPKVEKEAEDPPLARRSTVACDDGSCFRCGDAVCLTGFYCSVGRSGRGCAWLPSCAVKPTCACIAPFFRDDPSCACDEREGGIFVTCDGAKL